MIDYKHQPPVKPFGEFRIDMPSPMVLPNGVDMYVVAGGDQEVNRIEVIHRGGMFEESPHRLVAQATVSLMSQGTESMSPQDIAECIDYNGAWVGPRSTHNHTVMSLNSLNRCLDRMLPVLRDMILSPSFPGRELEVYRNRCLSAYRTSRERVKYLAGVEMNRLFWGDEYPLSAAVTDEDVLALDSELLRRFHGDYIHAANRTVILSGGITAKEIDMVAEAFGSDRDERAADELVMVGRVQGSEHFSFVEKEGAVQSAIQMQLPAIPRTHPDYFKLRILVTALGGYFGSRLMSNVREEKGYTYGIWASLIGARQGAYVSISTECDCAYTRPLIDEVKHEMETLRNEPIPIEELDMVKSSMLSELVKNLDTPFSIASNVGAMILYGIYPEYFNEQIRAIRAVTPEELLVTARRYLTEDDLYTVVAGQMQ